MRKTRPKHSNAKSRRKRKKLRGRRIKLKNKRRKEMQKVKQIKKLNALKTKRKIVERLSLYGILDGIQHKSSLRSLWNNLGMSNMLCFVKYKVMRLRLTEALDL